MSWTAVAIFCLLGGSASLFITKSLAGRGLPEDAAVIDLSFPMGPGIYLVANGGSDAVINAHFLTLDPKTERQAAYRGQSYAVDFIKINALGFRAAGWRPRNPDAYAIFGQPVLAPCDGQVIQSRDGQVDMVVPEMDHSQIEGNHVTLQCGDVAVFLGHLRQGSVSVSQGDEVVRGDRVGEAGNSGQTGEPHLHIHAQRLPSSGPMLSGDPLYLTLDGIFPIRNQRLVIKTDGPLYP